MHRRAFLLGAVAAPLAAPALAKAEALPMARAAGGIVRGGPYLVGERGPEFFLSKMRIVSGALNPDGSLSLAMTSAREPLA